MTKLYQYFKNDFNYLSIDRKLTIGVEFPNGEIETVEIEEKMLAENNSSARFFVFYIPDSRINGHVIRDVLTKYNEYKKGGDGLEVIMGYTNDLVIGNHSSVYSNRIYFYTEVEVSKENLAFLEKIALEENLYITIRSQDYVNKRIELEKPIAFISHDSRDKELIAKPLANGLQSRLCPVWYDEYSLMIGDSLRESIEKGIKEVKKCVIIITQNFLTNPGWSKKEFDSIFTREMIFNESIVLPIWFGVTKKEVYEYSPSLADTVALIWPNPKELNEADYRREIEILISKIHTAVIK